MTNSERPSRSTGMYQFLRDYDEYCAEVEWEKEMIRLGRMAMHDDCVKQSMIEETNQDPDQIILNLETGDNG